MPKTSKTKVACKSHKKLKLNHVQEWVCGFGEVSARVWVGLFFGFTHNAHEAYECLLLFHRPFPCLISDAREAREASL